MNSIQLVNSKANFLNNSVDVDSSHRIKEISYKKVNGFFYRLAAGFSAFVCTVITLGLALLSSDIRNLWRIAFLGKSKVESTRFLRPSGPSHPVDPKNHSVSPNNTDPKVTEPSKINDLGKTNELHKGLTFDELLANTRAFEESFISIPTKDNQICNIATTEQLKKEVVEHANNTRPILHANVVTLISDFLGFKQEYGSSIEKSLYKEMTVDQFIDRLIVNRPLVFMTAADYYKLDDWESGNGGFDSIGTSSEKFPLLLKDYLSYDEMQISAMLSMAVPTHFINDGSRTNRGVKGQDGSYEEKGIYYGLVGARFERPGRMEWEHMLITKEQNVSEKGYGSGADPSSSSYKRLQHWAKFYGENDYFPSYEEAVADTSGKFLKIGKGQFLNVEVYKQRMRMSIEPFLAHANESAKTAGKQAYVHAVGIGIGVWAISVKEQGKIIVDVYKEIIESKKLKNISDIDFSWFPDSCVDCGGAKNDEELVSNGNTIKIHFSKRNPAAKLVGKDAGKLLAASYAWDGNSFPGNEYWSGALSASGDPAAACCSTIPQLQNPYINVALTAKKTVVVGDSVKIGL